MEFVIWGTDFAHRAGEFCQRVRSELYFFTRFRTDFQTEHDGDLITGRAGDLLVARPGDVILHGPLDDMTEGFVNDWIKLSGDDVGALLDAYPLPLGVPFRVPGGEALTRCIEEIDRELSTMRVGYHEKCELIFKSTVIDIHRALVSFGVSREDKLSEVRQRLVAECESSWTLAEMAALSGYSQSRFSSLYRDRFGISPIEDLIGIRIARAKLLLLHGAMSVEEVAERVGFSSIYYFSRIFRARTGVSPSAWISQNKNDCRNVYESF